MTRAGCCWMFVIYLVIAAAAMLIAIVALAEKYPQLAQNIGILACVICAIVIVGELFQQWRRAS